MMYPLVRDLAADGIPVVVTCRVLGFTPQASYKWRARPVSERDWDDAYLVDAAREIHSDDPVSATASSPTSSPPGTASKQARTGSSASAAPTASSRSWPGRRAGERDPAIRCMTTWSDAPLSPSAQ